MKKLHNFGFRKQDDSLKEQVIYEFSQPRLYDTVCKSTKKLYNFGFRKQHDTLQEQVIYEFLQPRLYGTVCKSLSHTPTHTHTCTCKHTQTTN